MGDYRDKFVASSPSFEYNDLVDVGNQQSLNTSYTSSTQVYNCSGQYKTTYGSVTSSEQNFFPRGGRCAFYDTASPSDCKLKPYNKLNETKQYSMNGVNLIADKLNELKIDNGKNPVAKLYEFMAVLKKPIKYDIVTVAGHVHSPIFTIRVSNGDTFAYGRGSSKKEAKNNAASTFLKMFDTHNVNDITSTTSNASLSPSSEVKIQNTIEMKTEINYIGVLQELCMANHWQLPDYKFIKTEINEMNLWYKVICSVMHFKCIGENKTKQSAKKNAARLLYEKITCLTPEQKANLKYVEFPNPSECMIKNNSNIKKSIDSGLKYGDFSSSEAMQYVETFFNQLRSSENQSMLQLKALGFIEEFRTKSVDFLAKIGEEEGFNITYVELNNPMSNAEVMIQVSIFPLLVNLGTGSSVKDAQENAAYTVLVYLKLLLEK